MNRKGQALVEFVFILPVFLFILFVIYDFGMVFNRKNILISDSSDIVELYRNGKTIEEINGMYSDVLVEVDSTSDYNKLTLTSNVKLITPGLNRVFGNPYKIKVERYIPNEE